LGDPVIYAGSSGYSFKEWVGTFYPPKTRSRDFLSYYASELTSVEINHTFRRFPRTELMESWAETTPETFRFSFKMHQSVTHRARLKNVGRSVRDFIDALAPLGPRLGVVLFQLPPFFRCDLDRLGGFLKELPAGCRYAMEFRHESWTDPEVELRLREARVALAAADVEIEETPDATLTAPFGYVRFRKAPPYSQEEVERAAALVTRLSARVEEIFLYLKHDDAGLAPKSVKEIVERASSAT
jgi:uncharacterized protein YecE (DUF72 family)